MGGRCQEQVIANLSETWLSAAVGTSVAADVCNRLRQARASSRRRHTTAGESVWRVRRQDASGCAAGTSRPRPRQLLQPRVTARLHQGTTLLPRAKGSGAPLPVLVQARAHVPCFVLLVIWLPAASQAAKASKPGVASSRACPYRGARHPAAEKPSAFALSSSQLRPSCTSPLDCTRCHSRSGTWARRSS